MGYGLSGSGSGIVRTTGNQTISGVKTFTGETVMTDRLRLVQVVSGIREALKITGANAIANSIYWEDFFGNPGWTLPTTGGDAMLGDRRRAFRPGDVFNTDWQVLTGSGDNIATNAGGFQLGHGTGVINFYAGTGVPGAAHPVTSGVPANGSFYFRLDGGAGTTVYQVRAAAWVGIV